MITRRTLLKSGVKAALAFTLSPTLTIEAAESFDLLIKGGTILDGTGGPSFIQDLGIVGDTIVAIDSIPRGKAKKVIDASELMVSPGFVDIHSHSDSSLPAYP